MKSNFLKSVLHKTALAACFLLCLNHCGICQNGTANPAKSEAYSPAFDLESHVPEIVRDLKVCDAIREERDILKPYNQALKGQLSKETKGRIDAEKQRDKLKLKTKGQARTIAALIGAIIVREGLKYLIRR